jgi:hypothetical protein
VTPLRSVLLNTFFGFTCRPLWACLTHGRCWTHSEEEIDDANFEAVKAGMEEHLGPVVDDVVARNAYTKRLVRVPLLHPKAEYTCHDCPGADPDGENLCEYAWDEYNTHGDCLANK